MNSVEWPVYLMGFAKQAAIKSKDSTRVGAVLVGPSKEVLLNAYNGIPMRVQDLAERRDTRPEKYYWVSHAEANLIAFAARHGISTEGKTIYVTHCPCNDCAKLIVQAGISKVVYGQGSTQIEERAYEVSRQILSEAGVDIHPLHEELEQWQAMHS